MPLWPVHHQEHAIIELPTSSRLAVGRLAVGRLAPGLAPGRLVTDRFAEDDVAC